MPDPLLDWRHTLVVSAIRAPERRTTSDTALLALKAWHARVDHFDIRSSVLQEAAAFMGHR